MSEVEVKQVFGTTPEQKTQQPKRKRGAKPKYTTEEQKQQQKEEQNKKCIESKFKQRRETKKAMLLKVNDILKSNDEEKISKVLQYLRVSPKLLELLA